MIPDVSPATSSHGDADGTYGWAAEGVHVTREEATGGSGMARVVEVSLNNAVVASRRELELDDVADGSLDFIGAEDQATFTDHDRDGRSAGLHCQAGCKENTCQWRHFRLWIGCTSNRGWSAEVVELDGMSLEDGHVQGCERRIYKDLESSMVCSGC